MRALVRTGHEKGAVSVEEIERPPVEAGQVRIHLRAAGVCGSDVGAYLGKPEYDFMAVPAVLGHECAGVVDSVGAGVTRVTPGDRVVLQPGEPCDSCFQCLSGEPNNCPEREPGVAAGGFAPYTVADAARVLPVPEDVPIERAALAEPLAVTRRAVVTHGEITPSDTVLVQGPGPMGTFSSLIAREAGADVVVTGLPDDADRLERLDGVGIETAVVSGGEPTPDAVADAAAARGGFDISIDATGAAVGVETAVEMTRDGGNVVVLGIVSDGVDLDMAELVRAEVHLRTSHGSVAADFLAALELLGDDGLPVDRIVDSKYSPREPAAAFDAFAAAETIKPVFDLDELA